MYRYIEQSTASEKGAEITASNALKAFEALANQCNQIAEPYLCHHLAAMLTAAAHKNAKVRSAAESAVRAVTTKMSANALRQVFPTLFKLSEVGVAWQTRALCLKTVASFGDHAPEQLGFSLPDVRFSLHHNLYSTLVKF